MRKALLIAVLVLAVAAPADAGQTAAKCEAKKLKTAGKYGDCLFKALSKAAKKGSYPSYIKCDSKFAGKWAKIEAKGGCAEIWDAAVVGDAVIAHFETATSFYRTEMVSVSAGTNHTCAIKSAGTIECWGQNYDGQSSPPSGTFFTEVSAGRSYTCAINSPGVVGCWGYDGEGQSSSPAGTFTQVSTGFQHACAINSSGTVECWGSDISGQVGDAPTSGTFTQVAGGGYHTCAINILGAVECWGSDGDGQSSPPSGTFTEVAAGGWHTCAINSSGAVQCWGWDDNGQASPPAGTFTQVSAGSYHTCGINISGAVECWGLGYCGDTTGAVGADGNYGQACPTTGTFTEVSAGGSHTCAINSSGAVECWGRNNYGQSSGAPRCWSAPLKVVGKYGSCRLKMDAKAVKKGTNPDYSKCDAKFGHKWAKAALKEAESCPAIADLESSFQTEAVTYADDIAAMLASE